MVSLHAYDLIMGPYLGDIFPRIYPVKPAGERAKASAKAGVLHEEIETSTSIANRVCDSSLSVDERIGLMQGIKIEEGIAFVCFNATDLPVNERLGLALGKIKKDPLLYKLAAYWYELSTDQIFKIADVIHDPQSRYCLAHDGRGLDGNQRFALAEGIQDPFYTICAAKNVPDLTPDQRFSLARKGMGEDPRYSNVIIPGLTQEQQTHLRNLAA